MGGDACCVASRAFIECELLFVSALGSHRYLSIHGAKARSVVVVRKDIASIVLDQRVAGVTRVVSRSAHLED